MIFTPIRVINNTPVNTIGKSNGPLGFIKSGDHAFQRPSVRQCTCLLISFEVIVSLSCIMKLVINVAFSLIST